MSYASAAIKRLSNEYRHLQKEEDRVSDYYVAPLEENIFEWHFTLRGPAGDDNKLPYKDGLYHGALIFSRSYPLEPPDIMFFTRSGRFATHEKICSTISSFHKELWQPTYDVALTLTALRHFMAQEDEFGIGAFPKNMVAIETKLAWAKESRSFTCTTCGRGTLEVWETEMKQYPETSVEKAAQVPKLPPVSASPAGAAGAGAGEKADIGAAASPSPTAVPPPESEEEKNQHRSSSTASCGDRTSVEQREDVSEPPVAASASPVPSAASPASSPLLEAPTAGGDHALGSTGASPSQPPLPLPASAAAATATAAPEDEEDERRPLDGDHEESAWSCTDVTQTRVWHNSAGDEFFPDVVYDGVDEDDVATQCYLNSLPLLNEEARQLEMADTSSGISDVRFEPVLRAAIRREEHEMAVAVALAAGEAPPPPSPPGLCPNSHELLHEELPAHLIPLEPENILPPAAVQPPPPPPPPQSAENVVFVIHTYRLLIPLHHLDRAIIWSFSIIVLILLRRAVWALLPAMWS